MQWKKASEVLPKEQNKSVPAKEENVYGVITLFETFIEFSGRGFFHSYTYSSHKLKELEWLDEETESIAAEPPTQLDIIHKGVEFAKGLNADNESYLAGAGYGYSCGYEKAIEAYRLSAPVEENKIPNNALQFFQCHKITLTGVNGGDYLDEEDFYKFAKSIKPLSPAPTVSDIEGFLPILQENYQAQIAGYYNYDKTDEERKIRNAVIEEYKDLIAIYKAKCSSKAHPSGGAAESGWVSVQNLLPDFDKEVLFKANIDWKKAPDNVVHFVDKLTRQEETLDYGQWAYCLENKTDFLVSQNPMLKEVCQEYVTHWMNIPTT